jgi:flagellar motility protein MotE (MotC chaperone)
MRAAAAVRAGRTRAATWVAALAAAALALGTLAAPGPDAAAGARRPGKKARAAAVALGDPRCQGPFTPEELELYAAAVAARDRIAAADAALALRGQLLQAREQELLARQEELLVLERRLDERLAALEKDEAELHRLADELGEREEQAGRAGRASGAREAAGAAPPDELTRARRMNAAQLAVMVRSMRPEAAARLLEQLPSGLSSEVVSRLPARQSGRILSVMDPDVASGLSVAFVLRDPERDPERAPERAPERDAGGAAGRPTGPEATP